jgi:hypothetical protein
MGRFPEDFYGFPEVPLHIHLGMRFLRPDPDGDAVVEMPASPNIVDADGRHSLGAVYTVGEVAAGIAVCDALVLNAAEAETAMVPLVLTRETQFTPHARARGTIRSQTSFVGDSAEAVERLRSSRKVMVKTEARLHDDEDTLAGELIVDFYVRLMDRSRLEAMAGALTPTMSKPRTEEMSLGGSG